MRRPGWLLATLVLVASLAFAAPANATDYCGNNEGGIWLTDNNFNSYGSQGQVIAVEHSLVNCGGFGRTTTSVNTVGAIFLTDGSAFVEVGYMKYLYCTIGCSTSHKVFGEWGFYPAQVGGPYFYSNVTAGTLPRFKSVNVNGTFDWKIYWDSSGGSNFTLIDTYQDMWGKHGWAYGEGSRHGKTGTDIVDHHYDMNYKDSSSIWHLFSSLVCYNDTDADYKWSHISAKEFQIVAGSHFC